MQKTRENEESLLCKEEQICEWVSEKERLGQQFREVNMWGVKSSGQLGGVEEEEDEGSGGVSCRSWAVAEWETSDSSRRSHRANPGVFHFVTTERVQSVQHICPQLRSTDTAKDSLVLSCEEQMTCSWSLMLNGDCWYNFRVGRKQRKSKYCVTVLKYVCGIRTQPGYLIFWQLSTFVQKHL